MKKIILIFAITLFSINCFSQNYSYPLRMFKDTSRIGINGLADQYGLVYWSDTTVKGYGNLYFITRKLTSTQSINTAIDSGWAKKLTYRGGDTTGHGVLNYNISKKQDSLISGTNIKTINGSSILGSGNITTGLSYFTETYNTSTPNATIPSAFISATGAETNIDAAIIPKGTGAFQLANPDNGTPGGNKRGNYSVDLQLARSVNSNVSSGNYSFSAGTNCKSSSSNSISIGDYSYSTNQWAISMGRQALADKQGEFALGCANSTSSGNAQSSIINLYNSTSNTTPTELYCGVSNGKIVMKLNSTCAFEITIVGTNSTNSENCFFRRSGLFYRNSSNTAALEGVVQTIGTDIINSNLAGVGVDISADNTNKSIRITVTGLDSKTIKWVANVRLTTVTN